MKKAGRQNLQKSVNKFCPYLPGLKNHYQNKVAYIFQYKLINSGKRLS